MHFNDITYESSESIVNGFSDFFSTTYLPPSYNNDYSEAPSLNAHISVNTVSENDIILASKKLKNKMTAGVDNVPSFIVKDCIYAFVRPLSCIFNLILSTGTYPDIWKTAKICPIHKTGDRSSIDNYRPIAIISNFGKLFEIIVYEAVYGSVKQLISPFQHGFVSQRSTVTNLICLTQYISNTLDGAGQVDVIYTDIRKAFDQIDHCLLLSKLQLFGFSNPLLKLIKSYLLDRNQYVEYAGVKSGNYIATSGVPQGSNLGPLLFIVFINDISNVLTIPHLLFADDLKIYLKIDDSLNDCAVLQDALNKVHLWCAQNSLQLNLSKCKVVSFHRRHNVDPFGYSIDGVALEKCDTFKDLGILFDRKLAFDEHIADTTASARRLLGYLVRNWGSFSNIETLKLLYVTFIRSRLEYAAVVWSPIYQNLINSLESVQRKCMKYIFFKSNGYYPPRGCDNAALCAFSNLQSLTERRSCSSLTFLCKLFKNEIDCDCLLSQFRFHVPRAGSRPAKVFDCDIPKTNMLIKSPIFRMSKLFNDVSHLCDLHFHNTKFIIDTFKGMPH